MNVLALAQHARAAAALVAAASTEQKNRALLTLADRLQRREAEIVEANHKDLQRAEQNATPRTMLDRLRFDASKLQSRIESLRLISQLPDPNGQTAHAERRPNGLEVAQVRVPIGVILMVFEARPHVTINAGALGLKAGNAMILRGGSEALQCNQLLGQLWSEALDESGLPSEAVQVVGGSHQDVGALLQLDEDIDLVIPRGSKAMVRSVVDQSRIPVLKHLDGVCHVYLDEGADLDQGLAVALDSKTLMPEVCNAMETLLVHRAHLDNLPKVVAAFERHGVDVRGCAQTCRQVPKVQPATEADWTTEYLDLIVSVRVVDDVESAIEHISQYGSHHTDTICTDSVHRARLFTERVDSAVVLVNASTMFCDGATLGMGAEIGISTDRLHARGPVGLEGLTTLKFVIQGKGHLMGPPRISD